MSERLLDGIRNSDGPSAPPRHNGELVFEAPWQGRAFATAIALIEHLGIDWDEFRSRLIAAIETDANRPYYESWLAALESLAADANLVDPRELAARLTGAT